MKIPVQSTLVARSRIAVTSAASSDRVIPQEQCVEGQRKDAPFGSNCRAAGYGCMACSGGQWVCDGYLPGRHSCV